MLIDVIPSGRNQVVVKSRELKPAAHERYGLGKNYSYLLVLAQPIAHRVHAGGLY